MIVGDVVVRSVAHLDHTVQCWPVPHSHWRHTAVSRRGLGFIWQQQSIWRYNEARSRSRIDEVLGNCICRQGWDCKFLLTVNATGWRWWHSEEQLLSPQHKHDTYARGWTKKLWSQLYIDAGNKLMNVYLNHDVCIHSIRYLSITVYLLYSFIYICVVIHLPICWS